MKKRIFTLVIAILTLSLLVCASVVAASASEETPTVSIDRFNLTFESDTYIKYAVKFSGVDDESITRGNTGMLYWTEPQTTYTIGSESSSSEIIGYTTIDGEKYYTFAYDKFAAKQMTDYIYSVAYIVIDGEYYYSAPVKYSILTYAYDKLGYTGSATENATLREMLDSLLTYGALAQKYFDYKSDRLADAQYYQVSVEGGRLEDGFTAGLYLEGEHLSLVAPATDVNGVAFSHWSDKSGSSVSASASFNLTVKAENNTYTAVYGEGIKYSEGLEFDTNGDGSCVVVGIGICEDTDIVIPPTALDNEIVVAIESSAFASEPITSVSIPAGVTSIGRKAFNGCTALTDVYYDGTEEEWNENVTIASGNDPILNATMHFKSASIAPTPEYTEPTIVVSSATAKAGDAGVNVTVALKKNPGITSMLIDIHFDDAVIELVNMSYNEDLDGTTIPNASNESPVTAYWAEGFNNVTGDWTFVTLSFNVLSNATAGEYDITVSYDSENIYDVDETNIAFAVVSGKITVEQ